MKRINGGTQVKGGYYFHVGSWEVATITEDIGTLPGGPDDKYIHASLPVLFVAVPVLGAAFAMFLPFLGFAMPVYALGKKIVALGRSAAGEAAATVTPTWAPGEAYLAGKPQEPKKNEPAATNPAGAQGPAMQGLTDLEKEIAARREKR